MGHKTYPIGFRLGVSKDWQSRWFAPSGKEYKQFVWEDLQIRSSILEQYPDASISKIEIERNSSDLIATIYTARPGIVIGRGGQRVEELRKMLEELTSKKARLNVQEIPLNADILVHLRPPLRDHVLAVTLHRADCLGFVQIEGRSDMCSIHPFRSNFEFH